MNSAEPAFHGYVESTHDALLVFTACAQKRRPTITRRLQDKERHNSIRSGAVFVFDEATAGIKRWTDGFAWSPSRILGNFLVYRELDKRKIAPPPQSQTTASPQPSSSAQMASTPTIGGAPASADVSPPSSARPVAASGGGSPPQTPGTSSSSASSLLGSFTRSTGAGDTVDIPTTNADGTEGVLTITRGRERILVGSLTSSYNFKVGGLIKKTISLGSLHMISYYTIEDVVNARLRRPSSLDEFNAIEIKQEFIVGHNFRSPPDMTEGRVRWRTAAEETGSPPLPSTSAAASVSNVSTPASTSFPIDGPAQPASPVGVSAMRMPDQPARARTTSISTTGTPSHPGTPTSPGSARYRRQSLSSATMLGGVTGSSRPARFEPYPTSHTTRYGHTREGSSSALGLPFVPSAPSSSTHSPHSAPQEWPPTTAGQGTFVFSPSSQHSFSDRGPIHQITQQQHQQQQQQQAAGPAPSAASQHNQNVFNHASGSYRAADSTTHHSNYPYNHPGRPPPPPPASIPTGALPPQTHLSHGGTTKTEEPSHTPGSLYGPTEMTSYSHPFYGHHSNQVYSAPMTMPRNQFPVMQGRPAAQNQGHVGNQPSGQGTLSHAGYPSPQQYHPMSTANPSHHPDYSYTPPATAFSHSSGAGVATTGHHHGALPQPSGMVIGMDPVGQDGSGAPDHGHISSHGSGHQWGGGH